ncbi:hypothetical protein H0H93_012402, partial [Arthromyces matolae]
MSPTFIRLKHLVLASLIAAAVVHQSSSFAEAAPTPPLTNKLLSRDSLALAPSVNSDFFVTIPIISSDADSDIAIGCEQDQFANDPRCVEAPTLIRRDSDDPQKDVETQWTRFNNSGSGNDTFDKRMEILVDNVEYLAVIWNRETPRPTWLKDAFHRYYRFFLSSEAQDQMIRLSISRLSAVLNAFGTMGFTEPHEFRLTKVLYHYLTMGNINTYCLPTMQLWGIAREIAGLQEDLSSTDHREEKRQIVEKFLPKFRDLLKRQANEYMQGHDLTGSHVHHSSVEEGKIDEEIG